VSSDLFNVDTKRVWPPRSQFVQAGWFLVAAVGAAYLWAVIFGDGIAGLADGYTLSHRTGSDLPNANVAFIVAVGAYVGSPALAWWASPTGRFNAPRWLVLTATVGFLVFVASRLFV
jgi:hypothetical protein